MYLSAEQLSFANISQPRNTFTVMSILEKGSGEINEDVLLEDGNLFGVFDGATSLDGSRFQEGLTGGLLAARTASQSFQENGYALDILAQEANHRIRKMQVNGSGAQLERQKLWSTSFAVIRLIGKRLEYCQSGDAQILIIGKNGTHRVITPDLDIDRETLQAWKEMQVVPGTRVQDVLADQILKVRLEMNVSYGVLNGEPEALDFISHGFADLDGVSDILLFTDGLLIPREDPLADHDWRAFVEIYRLGGLQAIRNHVRRLQRQDPDCRKFPRFKTHDDIAAVSISC
jgi:serine/threonine protein phosphatase PrpC